MTSPERIGKLLYRYTRKELSGKEEAELLSWRGLSLRNEKLFETETDRELIRKQVGQMFEDRDYVFQRLVEEYPQIGNYKPQKPMARLNQIIRVAAACVIIGVGLYFIFKWHSIGQPGSSQAQLISYNNISHVLDDIHRGFSDGSSGIMIRKNEKGELIYHVPNEVNVGKDKYNIVTTPRKGQFTVKFQDGTLVWLNAESSVRYPVNFSQDTIQLEIQGEAYIEIAPDTKHYFAITLPPTANRQPLTIVRTFAAHLNVVNYPREDASITVIEDSAVVALENMGTRATYDSTIHAGYQAKEFDQTFNVEKVKRVDNIIAWKDGVTVFHEANMLTIMNDISRWYDVDVVYTGTIPDKRYNLNLPRDANLKDLLSELKNQGAHVSLFWRTVTVNP